MDSNRMKHAMDSVLSSLYVSERTANDLLNRAVGGEKVKRKISVALVLTICIFAIATTAAAVITIREIGQHVARQQKESGYFAYWDTQHKITLIRALLEQKYMQPTPDTTLLLEGKQNDKDANATADRILSAYTGKSADSINFLSIMQVPMGTADTWTYAEKAWYSQLMREVGLEGEGVTFYTMPQGKLNEQDALAIARREVALGYGVPESQLDAYKVSVSFEVPEAAEPGDSQGWWRVEFAAPDGMDEQTRLFILFPVFVHPETGALMHSVQSMRALGSDLPIRPENEIYQAIGRIEDAAGPDNPSFRTWPLALKARWSQEVRPLVQQAMASGDLSSLTWTNMDEPDYDTMARSYYQYALPDEKAIPETQAYALATAALQNTYGLAGDVFPLYRERIVYYDITTPETRCGGLCSMPVRLRGTNWKAALIIR